MNANAVAWMCVLGVVAVLVPNVASAEDDCGYRIDTMDVVVEASPEDSCVKIAMEEVQCPGGVQIELTNACSSSVRVEFVESTHYGLSFEISSDVRVTTIEPGLTVSTMARRQEYPADGEEDVERLLFRANVGEEVHELSASFRARYTYPEYDETGCTVRNAQSPTRGVGAWWIGVLGLVGVGLRVRKRV